MYDCWLGYPQSIGADLAGPLSRVAASGGSSVLRTARTELLRGLEALTGVAPALVPAGTADPHVMIAAPGSDAAGEDEVIRIFEQDERIVVTSNTEAGCLHAVFAFLRGLQTGQGTAWQTVTRNRLRMVSHWDNLDGTIERGYAGASIFFADGQVTTDLRRVRDYARLLASAGVNAVCVNNVNVTHEAARQSVNEWIRRGHGFDAAIDFDRAVRDADSPRHLAKAFDSGDHLHLNPAGYQALADAVPAGLLADPVGSAYIPAT
jgi:alpha-glucuronidase